MSQQATQPQTENLLLKETENLSQLVYGKPYAELDEKRQELMRRSARALLRERCTDMQPGFCYSCGKAVPFEMTECRTCHDPIDVMRTDYSMRKGLS